MRGVSVSLVSSRLSIPTDIGSRLAEKSLWCVLRRTALTRYSKPDTEIGLPHRLCSTVQCLECASLALNTHTHTHAHNLYKRGTCLERTGRGGVEGARQAEGTLG